MYRNPIFGGPCEIVLDAYPQVTFKGFVKKIIPTADRTRATVQVKIAFDSLDSRVLPEMSARVNFLSPKDSSEKTEPTPVLVVDHRAITTRSGQKVVFVVNGELAKMIPVEVGRRLGDVTEITSGLQPGQETILSPTGGLKTGDKIVITH